MKFKRITPPQSQPVSVQALKDQLRIEHNEENDLVKTYILAATEYAEKMTGNQIISQRWQIAFDAFDCDLTLPLRPLLSVESIQYVDENGELRTLDPATYSIDDFGFRGRIELVTDSEWPTTRAQSNAVLINATFGYRQPPARLQQAILLIAASWYENREDTSDKVLKTIPHGAHRLLSLDVNRCF